MLPRILGSDTFEAASASASRSLTTLGALLVVLVVAHFTVRSSEQYVAQAGRVFELDPASPSSYEGPALKLQPSMIVLGDSQQVVVSSEARNGPLAHGAGDTMLLEQFARAYEQRHPSNPPPTYLRFWAPYFGPEDALATTGLWIERARPRPVPVLIALDVFVASEQRPVRPHLRRTLHQFPDSLKNLADSLRALPDGEEAARAVTAPVRPTPLSPATLEARMTQWSTSHHFYYADPAFTPLAPTRRLQQLEAPFLQAIFGRIQQPGPPNYQQLPRPPEAPPDYKVLRPLITWLINRGMSVICYVQPYNPNVIKPSTLNGMVARMREAVTEAGGSFIDAHDAVPAAAENWGFAGGVVDHLHLTAVGARTLAEYLLAEGERIGAWAALERGGERQVP